MKKQKDKNITIRKPDSVPLEARGYHLSCHTLLCDLSAYPPASGEQPSAHRYTWHFSMQGLPVIVTITTVSSYLTFSPLSRVKHPGK